jgi:hypothetical protein
MALPYRVIRGIRRLFLRYGKAMSQDTQGITGTGGSAGQPLDAAAVALLQQAGYDVTSLQQLLQDSNAAPADDGWNGQLLPVLMDELDHAVAMLYKLGYIQESPGGEYVPIVAWPPTSGK